MDEAAYSGPEVAELVNQHFIPVKMDRDAGPDVNRKLQEAAQLISGQRMAMSQSS